MELTSGERQKLKKNPEQYLAATIKHYALNNPASHMPDFNNEPIIAEPLVGFADGFDPIFMEYKKSEIIGEFHLTPEEAFNIFLEKQGKTRPEKKPPAISVISVAFPPSRETRLSNPPKAPMASVRWGRAYGAAFGLMLETLNRVVSLLEAAGHRAVAPVLTRPPSIKISPGGLPYTDWSEKHAAYAAGLGTFGLHTSLITPAGIPLHIGSVITDLPLKPSPRANDNYRVFCLHFRDASCQLCADHCPSGAVNTMAFQGKKCLEYARNELPKLNARINGDTGKDAHPMCALCQIRVPCEAGIPRG